MNRTAVGVGLAVVLLTAGVAPAGATPPNAQIGTAPAQTGESCSIPVTATDATGTEVTVQDEPQRVVALGASTAQTLWDIGVRGKVVGMPVNPTTAYLDGSANRTNIYQSDGFTVATEQVVGLDPDLVLAPNVIPNETVATLRGAGLTVYKFEYGHSLEGIYAKTNRTGSLVGACDGAAETVADARDRVDAIEQAVAGEERPRVLYAQGGGFVAGNGTFIHEVMEAAGGDNLAADAGIQGYQRISNETVAERNPQWIIASSPATIPSGEPYASTAAVKRNQTVVVNSNLISQPGPRVVVPMAEIARQLHPQAMQEANLTNATATEQPVAADGGNATATTTGATGTAVATDGGTTAPGTSGTETGVETSPGVGEPVTDQSTGAMATGGGGASGGGENETETSSSNGPGFGVAVTVVALLGAALLARRL